MSDLALRDLFSCWSWRAPFGVSDAAAVAAEWWGVRLDDWRLLDDARSHQTHVNSICWVRSRTCSVNRNSR